MLNATSKSVSATKPVWFVTGCSTGFGRELAKQGLELDYRMVVTARNPADLKDLAGIGAALVLKLDVTDQNQVDAAIKAAEARFGRIDVLVNNAGIGYFAAVEESEEKEVRRMFEINVFGLSLPVARFLQRDEICGRRSVRSALAGSRTAGHQSDDR